MSRQVDERPYTHKLPPVTPLITPSVSPPRSRAPFRPSGHPPEHPSPSKRPRLVRTPSSPPSSAASASNAVALTVAEIEASRRAAVTRLSNAWSQLAKRYIRNLDEDDIIDLRSIDIVEDRGNIRALEPDAHVSSVWAGELPSADTSSDAGGAQTEVEDELDELDAFAGGGEEGGDHLPIVKSFVGVPPMRPGDPMDDHDLREFLEEEKTNQVKAGRLDDEYSDSQADNEQPVRTQHEDVEESAEEDSSSEDLPLSTVTQKPKAKKQPRARPRKSTRPPPARLSSRPLPPADESEDELGIWVNDESSAIYRVVRDDELIDDEEEASSSSPASNAAILPVLDDDVIEISDSDSPSPSPRRNRMERIPQPSSPSPAPRTLFQHKQSVPTSELQPVAVAPPQLQTPPQSFTSEFSFSPDPPSPPIDVPARPKPKPRPAYKGAKSQTRSQPLAFISEPLLEAAGPSVNSTFVAPATQTKSTTPIKVSPRLNKSTKRPTPQVIITGRARSAAPARTPLSEMVKPAQDEPSVDQREQPKVKGKGKAKTSVDSSQYHRRPKNAARDMPSKVDRKGKGRAVESPVESAASLGAITSPPSGSSSGSSPFSLRRTAITVSPPLKPSIGRKRKRRSSLPEIPANEIVESDLSKRPPESRGRRQSQEVAPSSPTSSSHGHESGRSVSPKPLKTFAGHRGRRSPRPVRSRSRSRAKPAPVPVERDSVPPSYVPYNIPYTPQHQTSYGPSHQGQAPPYPPLPDPQAQYVLAQVMQHLSYMMATSPGMLPPPNGNQMHWPPPSGPAYGQPYQPYWPPHASARPHALSSSSPMAGPSHMYRQPMYPYPHASASSPSLATLPPSSLPPSSPVTWDTPASSSPPITSSSRGRSKSRGRRVSFKLDEEPRRGRDREGSDDFDSLAMVESSSMPEMSSSPVARGRSRSAVPLPDLSAKSPSRKGKGKKAQTTSAGSGVASTGQHRSASRTPRGRTPGPGGGDEDEDEDEESDHFKKRK